MVGEGETLSGGEEEEWRQASPAAADSWEQWGHFQAAAPGLGEEGEPCPQRSAWA